MAPNGHTLDRATVRHRKTGRPVKFDITDQLRQAIEFDPTKYGTLSLQRTKATLIYRRTGNLRVAQLFLGNTKVESTVRYLGVEIDNALGIA